MSIIPVILAAGKGTRMKSQTPKVLHEIGGQAMLIHAIKACQTLSSAPTVVVIGHGSEQVETVVNQAAINAVEFVMQSEQNGTGHAVQQAESHFDGDDIVLVAYGDVPLISADTLQKMVDQINAGSDLVLLTCLYEDPTGYGRIIRDAQQQVTAIVEQKDASDEQLQVKEGNTGFIAARANKLKSWLSQLSPDNAQAEYYLTDCVSLAVQEQCTVNAIIGDDPFEVQGVNDRAQQAMLERHYQWQQAEALMRDGATLQDPARIDVQGQVNVGSDVKIGVNACFYGDVTLGDGVTIEDHVVIKDSHIGAHCTVKSFSHLEQVNMAKHVDVGPFARLRPGTDLADHVKVGNFVETKKAQVGEGSKISHLSYIGDADIGKQVNIGAGTITCNYDGVNKHQTVIGDGAFIGSDTQLVAPVKVGKDATIGAGSTVVKDAPDEQLTLSRAKQATIKGWQRPKKTNK